MSQREVISTLSTLLDLVSKPRHLFSDFSFYRCLQPYDVPNTSTALVLEVYFLHLLKAMAPVLIWSSALVYQHYM